jgi:outer membrane protein TolC
MKQGSQYGSRPSNQRVMIGLCLASAPAWAMLISGCTHSAETDTKINDLVRQRSELIDGGSLNPRRNLGEPEDYRRPGQAAKVPPTTNPPAEGLRFDPARDDRDVAKRLDVYAAKPEAGSEAERQTLQLTLEDALRIAQQSAQEFLNAEEEYILAAIRLLMERHAWGPRLFNDTSVTLDGQGTAGSFQSAVNVVNDLRVTQRLPYGGSVEAGWVWRATEQLREQATGRYRQSSDLVLSGNVPLLRGAGLVAQESLIQAERNLVYSARGFETFRRQFLVEIADNYFRLLQIQAQVRNQEQQIANLQRLETVTAALVEAGRKREFEKNQTAARLRQGIASLGSLREQYLLAVDRFKVRLGIPVDRPVEIAALQLNIPEPEISLEEAARRALEFRLDLQNQRDQLDDARRGVANARNNLLPDLDFTGRVDVPTDPTRRRGGVGFDGGWTSYSAGVTFGLPLDREIERLQVRQSIINTQQRQRSYEQFRDNVVIGVRSAVRSIDLARFRLELAEEQVRLNQRRQEEIELNEAAVSQQDIITANDDLLRAQNDRDQALTDLRNAVLTYLRDSGQLRVKRDGTFERLPGMDAAPAGQG